LWLAIVSGSEATIESVPPLPNLDRNILQGNSLLSPTDFLGDARGDIYRQWLAAIRAQGDLVHRYRTAPQSDRPALCRLLRSNDQQLATEMLARSIECDECELESLVTPRRDLFGDPIQPDAARCEMLHRRLTQSRALLSRIEDGALDFFSFDIHFAWILARGGFDLVAGNPPWVRNARIERTMKRMISERYALFRGDGRPKGEGFHQPDLSIAFFERSAALAAPGGVIAMLMPAKLLNAGYAAPLRRFAREQLSVASLHDWSDEARRHFEADTFPLALTVRKRRRERDSSIRVTAGEEKFAIPAGHLAVRGGGSEWALIPQEVGSILRRLRERCPPLTESLGRRPLMGVKTGDNSSFFLDVERIAKGQVTTKDGLTIPLDAVCRCARGRDIERWRLRDAVWMLWPPIRGWREAPVWAKALARARGIDVGKLRLSFVRPEHVGVKVVWKDVARGLCAVALPDVVHIDGQAIPLVPNQTLYSIDAVSIDEAYAIAGLLGSVVADALMLETAERAKDGHYRYFGRTVGHLAFPRLDQGPERERLVRLTRRAHHGDRVRDEIDAVAGAIYGLEDRDIRVLQDFVQRRLAR
jgi:hypothetical protein